MRDDALHFVICRVCSCLIVADRHFVSVSLERTERKTGLLSARRRMHRYRSVMLDKYIQPEHWSANWHKLLALNKQSIKTSVSENTKMVEVETYFITHMLLYSTSSNDKTKTRKYGANRIIMKETLVFGYMSKNTNMSCIKH